tara:strand:- start:1260 stop:1658 length:399 start_codon:yes stop_codon:yes gene_type:complete
MAITVTVTDTPTFVTVNETTNNVVLNRSDNPITVSTSLDLVQTEGSSDDITVTGHNNVYPTGNLTQALEKLADQFFRGTDAPTGSNLEEGDLWYDTDDNQLKVYRETSSSVFEFVPLAQATGTMNNLDGGLF